jgi:EAL domain-containing protein (putative c-di-GMP-specific phosphodiesterase class I)
MRRWPFLQRMVDCNVRLAVDNFGSSLAPLNHLVRLPIDVLKLDPS